MSHAWGAVIKDNAIRGYYEYDGNCDVAISAIWDTKEEMEAHWRGNLWNECTCKNPPEDVILYSDYGGGFSWSAKVCFNCRAIVDGYHHEDFKMRMMGPPDGFENNPLFAWSYQLLQERREK